MLLGYTFIQMLSSGKASKIELLHRLVVEGSQAFFVVDRRHGGL
jgi:hypothetical protein